MFLGGCLGNVEMSGRRRPQGYRQEVFCREYEESCREGYWRQQDAYAKTSRVSDEKPLRGSGGFERGSGEDRPL